jgi:hypothetical protein
VREAKDRGKHTHRLQPRREEEQPHKERMFRIFKGEGVDDLVMASSPSNSSLTGQLSARFAVLLPRPPPLNALWVAWSEDAHAGRVLLLRFV